MSQIAAFYFMRQLGMSRATCTWQREYVELLADGTCNYVSETEDGIFFRSTYPYPYLPAGSALSTRQAYRNAAARCLAAERRLRNKARNEKAALKLLRGGMKRHEHASREAGATVAAPEPVLVATPAPLPADVLADYTVFDVETTGFSAEKDALLEVAATRYTGGVPVDSMQSFVRFTGFIPPRITELTGITTKQVFRAPEAKQVLQEFKRIAGDSLLVGHNVAFDLRFVNAARARLGATAALPNPFLCTQVLAASRYPAPHKLGELCKRFNISAAGAHRAGADVLMTAKLLQHMHAQQPIGHELVNATSGPKYQTPAQAAAKQPELFAA